MKQKIISLTPSVIFLMFIGVFISSCDQIVVVPPEIGDNIEGGIVFYLDGHGGGLVCAENDLSNDCEWGCLETEITSGNGADESDIGTGQANTLAIITDCGSEVGYAAKICHFYDDGTYDDWYLPSKDELNLMWELRYRIGNFSGSDSYWSSTEHSDSTRACRQWFATGDQGSHKKDVSNSVRAIRTF